MWHGLLLAIKPYCVVDANNNSGAGANGANNITKNITVLANLSTTI